MNRLLNVLAADFCCVRAFVRDRVIQEPAWHTAQTLGVTERTVYNWKRRYRNDQLPRCVTCYLLLQRKETEN